MDMRDRILGGMRTGTGEDCIWTHVRKKAEELNDGSHISRCICNTVARREIKENISSRFVQSPSLTPPELWQRKHHSSVRKKVLKQVENVVE